MCDCSDNLRTAILLFLAGAMALVSCGPQGKTGVEELPPEDTGITFVLGHGAGSAVSDIYDFSGDWEVLSGADGYSIDPASGKAGEAELTVTAEKTNAGLSEKESLFSVSDGGRQKTFRIVQRGTPQLVLSETSYEMGQGTGKTEILLDGNIPFEADTDADWLGIIDITHSDQVLLSDGKTFSDSVRSAVTVQAAANTSAEARAAIVVLRSEAGDYEVAVSQSAPVSADWEREFFRRTSIMRFTATWCYNCPGMYEGICMAMEELPGRIIPINMHSMSSEGGLSYYQVGQFEELYAIEGYPTGIANNMVKIHANRDLNQLVPVITGVVEEAVESYPAGTGISAQSQIEDNSIKVDISVAVKEADDYRICVFLLENGIVYPQQTSGDGEVRDYVHDYVVRDILTEDIFGDQLPASGDKEIIEYSVESELPRSVIDADNLSVVIAVSRPCVPDIQGVEEATYLDLGTVYDNVVSLPANGFVNFEYEE